MRTLSNFQKKRKFGWQKQDLLAYFEEDVLNNLKDPLFPRFRRSLL
ncbi:hypothetical protein [Ulvibacter antarcticus]|nr:hypothetical protein [Ulvibacter antarcticus]